jgi:hypothetical protein
MSESWLSPLKCCLIGWPCQCQPCDLKFLMASPASKLQKPKWPIFGEFEQLTCHC